MLAPGRGLRGSISADMQNQKHAGTPWAVAVNLETREGPLHFKISRHAAGRRTEMNGLPLKRQLDLAGLVSALWVTPTMDLLFKEGMAVRRRFLDRLCISLDPFYAPLLLSFEKALKTWRFLVEKGTAPNLLPPNIEPFLAQRAVMLAAKRTDWLAKLLSAIQSESLCDKPFKANLSSGEKDDQPDTEQMFLEKLQGARKRYQVGSRLSLTFGPQTAKWAVYYDDVPIHLCSTGQQKMALLAFVLGAAFVRADQDPTKPFFLLLDELSSHLDQNRLAHICVKLSKPSFLPFITGTEPLKALEPLAPQLLSF